MSEALRKALAEALRNTGLPDAAAVRTAPLLLATPPMQRVAAVVEALRPALAALDDEHSGVPHHYDETPWPACASVHRILEDGRAALDVLGGDQ